MTSADFAHNPGGQAWPAAPETDGEPPADPRLLTGNCGLSRGHRGKGHSYCPVAAMGAGDYCPGAAMSAGDGTALQLTPRTWGARYLAGRVRRVASRRCRAG